MRKLVKYLILFLIGGGLYCLIELIARGHTHWTMGIVGGICFLVCGAVNECLSWDTALWIQMAICCLCITIIELISGCILNLALGLQIWDYSNLPLNFIGQICLYFSILWYFLSLVAIVLDDYIRYWFFGEEKPKYKFK